MICSLHFLIKKKHPNPSQINLPWVIPKTCCLNNANTRKRLWHQFIHIHNFKCRFFVVSKYDANMKARYHLTPSFISKSLFAASETWCRPANVEASRVKLFSERAKRPVMPFNRAFKGGWLQLPMTKISITRSFLSKADENWMLVMENIACDQLSSNHLYIISHLNEKSLNIHTRLDKFRSVFWMNNPNLNIPMPWTPRPLVFAKSGVSGRFLGPSSSGELAECPNFGGSFWTVPAMLLNGLVL